MKDQYVGDVGDYAKFSLFRTLGAGRRCGVAWYYNGDDQSMHGAKRAYLNKQDWARLDPEVFNLMQHVQDPSERLVSRIEQSPVMDGFTFSHRTLADLPAQSAARPLWRQGWFEASRGDLASCDFILVDPDTGLRDDTAFRSQLRAHMKYAPVSEALRFARQGAALIYHHHPREASVTEGWIDRLGAGADRGVVAIRFAAESTVRSFFLINPTGEMRDLARSWAERWPKASFIQ